MVEEVPEGVVAILLENFGGPEVKPGVKLMDDRLVTDHRENTEADSDHADHREDNNLEGDGQALTPGLDPPRLVFFFLDHFFARGGLNSATTLLGLFAFTLAIVVLLSH